VGKYFSNQCCFFKKITNLNFQPAQYEKINSTKIILEKKSIKRHVRKHCSNQQCFFSRKKLQNYIINPLNMKKKTKIDKDNSGKKTKKKEKNYMEKLNSVLKNKLQS
jgi:hypothetical protein